MQTELSFENLKFPFQIDSLMQNVLDNTYDLSSNDSFLPPLSLFTSSNKCITEQHENTSQPMPDSVARFSPTLSELVNARPIIPLEIKVNVIDQREEEEFTRQLFNTKVFTVSTTCSRPNTKMSAFIHACSVAGVLARPFNYKS